ncbi:MAG TPA: hypothetical protein VLG76_01420 [Rhabdochlamydiaceae bacterium]|nr:hypothetical protein [Rhabdochlamydiaceae bacterium]
MCLQPLMHRPPPQGVIVPYGWLAKILKIPVFRLALGNDLVSRIVIAVYNFFSRLCQGQSRSFRSFDPAIAQRSVDRFLALGANTHFVVPRDGRGKIQMMTFQAQDLEQRIQALGGSWERRNIQGRQVFAIVPPEHRGREWLDFKEKLSHFHWQEEEGMIVTCDCAGAIPLDAAKQCFLYAHSTSSSFASDWIRAGFYLGAKQDLCFFDNGNTWKNSGRAPSEESFYLEIEAVYNKIKDEYPVDRLWVGGSCGGTPVAAYLKRLLHHQGVNFFAEQSFPDLDDFVKPISPFFAPRIKGSLSDQTLPEKMEHRPPACQFGAAKLWENLSRYEGPRKGKFIVVQVRDDEHISQQAYERYLVLANRINANVKHLLYSSTAGWRHADDFFRYQAPRREFIEAIFN